MSRFLRPRSLAALARAASVTAITMSVAMSASAQNPKEIARARERFKEGAALQAAGDFARALEAYKEVALVKSSAQVRFNIATCEEKVGDYVRAMGSYKLALTEATRSNSKDIETAVQRALADLEPRIPMLLVKRGEGAAVASITLDGRPLANPSIGVEFAENPGPHTVAATSPDREPLSVDITLADRDHKTVEIVLKKVAKPPPVVAVAPVGPVNPPPPETGTEEPPPPPPGPNKAMLGAGIGFVSVGGILLITSAAFFAKRQSAISQLNKDCGSSGMSCPSSDSGVYSSGQTDAKVATGTFISGLGAAIVGGVLIGVALRKPKDKGSETEQAPKDGESPPPAASFTFTPGGAGMTFAF